MNNKEAIEAIINNYPPERYTMLREALDIALDLLKKEDESDNNNNMKITLKELTVSHSTARTIITLKEARLRRVSIPQIINDNATDENLLGFLDKYELMDNIYYTFIPIKIYDEYTPKSLILDQKVKIKEDK